MRIKSSNLAINWNAALSRNVNYKASQLPCILGPSKVQERTGLKKASGWGRHKTIWFFLICSLEVLKAQCRRSTLGHGSSLNPQDVTLTHDPATSGCGTGTEEPVVAQVAATIPRTASSSRATTVSVAEQQQEEPGDQQGAVRRTNI